MKQLQFDRKEWEEFLDNIDFTDDEVKVISLTRRGWKQEDIASELYISRRTVSRRYTSIMSKIVRYVLDKMA